jgi:beta-glucosidase-like glycosyl hydrolase
MLLALSCSKVTDNTEMSVTLPTPGFEILTESDYQLLREYAYACEIDDAVGQLFMVGLPTDIARYRQDRVIDKLINEFHIGWVFLNTYNYWWNERTNPSKNDVLSDITNFYNRIQDRALESGMRIPVGFSVNFEGGNFSSIGRILFQPPEALTIGASNNEKVASKIGSLVGHQLRQLGIHILLGPVFDIDSTSSREFVTRTQNRVFAGTPDLVTNIASHYLTSLKENGIIVIAKHFPGYGDVSENPHNNEMPESRDSFESLESNLIPYKSLESNIDGVMTAHMSINILDPDRSKIVTFSPLIVNDLYRKNERIEILEHKTLDGLNYRDKVAITDDLADMGAIRKYMQSNGFNWDDIVIQAFDAGHDILLFSVIEKDRNDSNKFSGFGDFDISLLEEIIKNFVEYIKSSKDNEDRFRTSLYRSLILKAKIAKSYDQSINDFLNGIGMEHWRLGSVREEIFKSIPTNDSSSGFEEPESIIEQALKAGYLEINKAADWDLKNAPADLNIAVFTDNSIDTIDEELLKHNFSKVVFYRLPRQKTERQYMAIYRQLESSLETSDKIYFSVSNQDDANIIKSAYEQHRNLVRQKLIILIHNTPTLIESNILQGVTVIGCFSSLYVSYVIDFDVILGRSEIGPAHNLTISLGSNGSVYDHKKSDFLFSLNGPTYKLLSFYATAKEKALTEENERLNNNIVSISDSFDEKEKEYIKIIIILSVFIILILFFHHIRKKTVAISSVFRKEINETNKPRSNNMGISVGIILIIALAIGVIVWYSLGENFLIIRFRIGISVILIIAIAIGMTVWYSLGEKFLSINKESTVAQIIFCAAYRHPKRISIMIELFTIIIMLFIVFPGFFQEIINVFK